MTVRKAGKGIVRSGGGTYQIGYTDLYGMEQETELSAFGMKDLDCLLYTSIRTRRYCYVLQLVVPDEG